MIVDAKKQILGRLASFAAKQAMRRNEIILVNCEDAVMTGNRKDILARYKLKLQLGQPHQGPLFYRSPDKFVKRTIRGMIPRKKAKGKQALSKIKCYVGIPYNLKDKEVVSPKNSAIEKAAMHRYVSVKEICRRMGYRK